MDQTTHRQHLDYQAAAAQVNESMAYLGRVCGDLGLREYAEALQALRSRMEGQTFSVGVVGEFKRGKSTVINSLLGEELLPADIPPATAVPTYIRWDTRPRAVVHFKDGTEKEIGVGDLPLYVTMLDEKSETVSATVEDAVVYCPCELCRNGVEIVDTPGRNLDRRKDQINEEILPRLDMAVMVIVPGNPFSMSESELIRRLLMSGRLKRLVFLVNKMDTIRRPEDRRLMLGSIQKRIQEQVLDKIAAMYDKNSEVYRDAEDKISGIRILSVSARSALWGRLDGDRRMVEESGIPEFEEALSRLLTEERAVIDLMKPVNSIMSIAREARKSIAIRRGALEMDADELRHLTDEAEAVIRDCRERRACGVAALRVRADALNGRLLSEMAAVYDGVERRLMDHVEQVHIAATRDKLQELLESMETQIKESLSEGMGGLLVTLQDQVIKDVEDFLLTAERITFQLNLTFRCSPSNNLFDWASRLTNTFIPAISLGSFIGDWEERGLPEIMKDVGAALHGDYDAWTFLFLPNPVSNLRRDRREAVKRAMKTLRTRRTPEQWLSDIVMNVYHSRLNQIDEEIENTLMGFVRTLDQVALDRQKDKSGVETIHVGMNKLEKQLSDIEETIRPVKNKFT